VGEFCERGMKDTLLKYSIGKRRSWQNKKSAEYFLKFGKGEASGEKKRNRIFNFQILKLGRGEASGGMSNSNVNWEEAEALAKRGIRKF
jgi:hypothetical protein